jgi:hypothetical protein
MITRSVSNLNRCHRQTDPSFLKKYERVENGDFNLSLSACHILTLRRLTPVAYNYFCPVGPFVPFASPKEEAKSFRLMKKPTRLVLEWFIKNGVEAVVRLNDPLYLASMFTSREISVLEMVRTNSLVQIAILTLDLC